MKKSLKHIARLHCSNWFNGKCIGCMPELGKKGLNFSIDSNFAGKECVVDKDDCHYFNNVVIPGLINEEKA